MSKDKYGKAILKSGERIYFTKRTSEILKSIIEKKDPLSNLTTAMSKIGVNSIMYRLKKQGILNSNNNIMEGVLIDINKYKPCLCNGKTKHNCIKCINVLILENKKPCSLCTSNDNIENSDICYFNLSHKINYSEIIKRVKKDMSSEE